MSGQNISELVKTQQLRGLKIEKRKSEKKENQWKILQCVLRFEPEGISTKELEERTGLNHDTVCIHCKYLGSKGLMKKKNKRGKYHLTEKAYGDRTVKAWIFKKQLMNYIHSSNIPYDKENVFSNITENDLNKDNYDKLSLFSFANRIGAIITYTMIEAIRPGAWIPRINRKRMTSDISGRNKDNLALEWINNVIDPIDLFMEFLKLPIVKNGQPINTPRFWNLKKIMKHMSLEGRRRVIADPVVKKDLINQIAIHNMKQKQLRKFEPSGFKRSRYEMNTKNFQKLVKAFGDVYPFQLSKLGEIRNSLDRARKEKTKEDKSLRSILI